MVLIKSSLCPNFSRIFRKWMDSVLGQQLTYCPEKQKNIFKRKMVHALHDMHVHVEEGIRALTVCLDSNRANMIVR